MQKKTHQLLIFRAILDVDGQEKKKPYRDIALLENQTLSTLARAIVRSFGFDFDHCYGFYDNLKDIYKSKEIFELFTDIGEEPTPGALGVERTKITRAFSTIGKTLLFLFDYGDGWQFNVQLIEKRFTDSKIKYPKVISRLGEAPEQYPPLKEEDGEEFEFDNCIVCQEMKRAKEKGRDLNLEELKELFDKQNKMN